MTENEEPKTVVLAERVPLDEYGRDPNGQRWARPMVFDYTRRNDLGDEPVSVFRMAVLSKEDFEQRIRLIYPGAIINYLDDEGDPT